MAPESGLESSYTSDTDLRTCDPDSKTKEKSETMRFTQKKMRFGRNTYSGAVAFNAFTFLIPAVYGTLSKLWIAQLDWTMVATTDVYSYLGVISEIFNEALPRAAYMVIGNKTQGNSRRTQLICTLLVFQMAVGMILSIVFAGAASTFASTFAPPETWQSSVKYVQISAFSTFFGCTEYALGTALRSFDRPDVPLVISMTKIFCNIVLDFAFLSTFRVYDGATVNTQAAVRLTCDGLGALAGLLYFVLTVVRVQKRKIEENGGSFGLSSIFNVDCLIQLARPGLWLFLESLLRNVLYLFVVAGIVALGNEYATAWGVFNTIRWGLIMVPTNALAESANAFTGHLWGGFVSSQDVIWSVKATKNDILRITRYARLSAVIVLVIEVILAIVLSFWLVEPFAYYLSGSHDVATLTAHMWHTLDWTYVMFAVALQVATVLQVTCPALYFAKTVASNIFWVLPWAIATRTIQITVDNAWTYHAWIFGGSLVFDFFVVAICISGWAVWLTRPEKLPRPIKSLFTWGQNSCEELSI